jgi:hypothetical protein
VCGGIASNVQLNVQQNVRTSGSVEAMIPLVLSPPTCIRAICAHKS